VIGAKTTLKGEVIGEEDIVVEGRVEGTVRIARDLIVAAGGGVEASVNARCVTVSGQLTGDCNVQERMEITASGKVFGDIKAPKIVIAEGAVFRGNSDMTGGRK
jgi:cytoskeletal protein CcmA (bactofilin family)